MASIQYNLIEFKYEKPKERLVIPSSVVSRIGSPIENFLDVPNSKELGLSFIETRSELKTPNDAFSDAVIDQSETAKNNILNELDNIKQKLKDLNQKIEKNLDVLKKTEKDNFSYAGQIHKEILERSYKEQINCTCTKQCNIF